MPKLMNQAIISVGDVSISIPDLKLKSERIFFKYGTMSVNANLNSHSNAGNTHSSSGVFVPILMPISTDTVDTRQMYSAYINHQYGASPNPGATGKFTAPETGLYQIQFFYTGTELSVPGNTAGYLTSGIYMDHGQGNTDSNKLISDGKDFRSFGHGDYGYTSYEHNLQVNLNQGDSFWVSVWNSGNKDSSITYEVQINLMSIIQETA